MRVAYVSMDSGVPAFGKKGCCVHLQEVIRAFVTHGAYVELFSSRVDGVAPTDLRSVRVHSITMEPHLNPAQREQQALAANGELQQLLERAGPFDLVYERYSLWSYAAMEFARTRGIPGVLEVNAPLIDEQASHRNLINREAAEKVTARIFEAARVLAAVSDGVAHHLEGFPNTHNRLHVIPNGVNTDRFAPSLRLSLQTDGRFTVGFVGTLKPWHGVHVLIDAFELLHKKYVNTRLLIVGDGPERDSIHSNLRQKNLTHAAQLTGAVDPFEVPRLLSSMDACVAPYPEIPNFYFSPLKVYEYMASGRPVVASRIGQLREVVHDGKTGLLCEPGNPYSLASKLETLVDSPALCRKLSHAARAQVVAQHTWGHVIEQIIAAAGLNRFTPNKCVEIAC
jgi:glycosyltransferase involved in cell wall biosynthesis